VQLLRAATAARFTALDLCQKERLFQDMTGAGMIGSRQRFRTPFQL